MRTAGHVLIEAEEITFTLYRARTAWKPHRRPAAARGDSTRFRESDADLTPAAEAIVSAKRYLEPGTLGELPAGPGPDAPRALPPGR